MRGKLAALAGLCLIAICVAAGAGDLQFLTPAWQGDTVKEVRAIVREWNEANPDIQVELIFRAWENIDDFMLTSFQGGQAPDLFHQDSVMCYEYGLLGYVEPLNDDLSDEILADIPKSYWDGVSDGETIYGVPFLQETLVIFYNKTMFADQDIIVPESGLITWEELREYARLLTVRNEAGTVTTWGLLSPLEQRFWWALIEQNQGQVLKHNDDGTWQVEIDDAAREAIAFYTDLVVEDRVMPETVLSYDFMSLLQGFKTGEYAMFSYGCWVRSWIARLTQGQLDWGMLQVEGPKENVTEADPQAIGIYSGSPHKEEAAQFLAFFTSTENQARLAYADWLFPTRQTALDRPEFHTEEDQWNVAAQWLPYARDVKPHMFGFFAWEWQSFIPQIELVILGSQDLDTALEAATVQGNQFLRRMGLQ
ncbi:ABC transporter substrate-binding protein [Candidatus Bipolaricaulota bacterium]